MVQDIVSMALDLVQDLIARDAEASFESSMPKVLEKTVFKSVEFGISIEKLKEM
jgi:hypothetical protein